MTHSRPEALLALEDGTCFRGRSFGARGERTAEVVFNTGMTGYLEVLTDPSYKGQMVAMTYPLIGNYGIPREDSESPRVHMEAFIIRELSRIHSNFRAQLSLEEFLCEQGVMGLEGIDTRALTLHIRTEGAMKAALSTEDLDPVSLTRKAAAAPGLEGRDLSSVVSCTEPYVFDPPEFSQSPRSRHVVVYDLGVKLNILRRLRRVGCRVTVVPSFSTAEQIMDHEPDGVMLSNGPGDPAAVKNVPPEVAKLLGEVPVFGICQGQHMLVLALGGRTYKLRFGHHGCNHPVMNLDTGKVDITVQNHGFCADIDSLSGRGVHLTHKNLNDDTLEGMRNDRQRFFCVQYHPEAAPGPHDARHLFDEFVALMDGP